MAAIAVLLVIVYGSLYPFHFQSHDLPDGPLRELLSTWPIPDDGPDSVSNFLLYLPFGFLLVRAWRAAPRWVSAPLATAAGFALSMCMEMAQFYDPGRVPAMADVFANLAGTAAGAAAAAFLRRDLAPGARIRMLKLDVVWRPFAVLLLLCWIGNRLFPYFPALGFHAVLTAPVPLDLYEQTVYWLAAAVLVESLIGVRSSRLILAMLVVMVLMVRVFVTDDPISSAETGGAVLAALLWIPLSRVNRRGPIVAALFVVLVILQALQPFQFNALPRSFGWIPFASFIDGPRNNGIRVFFEKAFTYGALVWLPIRAGASFTVATIFGVALVFALRRAQVFLPERSAEITDALIVLMMAGLLKVVREPVE
jgi:VanZ family protein